MNSGELDKNNTVVRTDIDNFMPVKIYNFYMIIAIGYWVNSKKATNFRIWVTKVLKEYMIKGVVMDGTEDILLNKKMNYWYFSKK